MNTSIGYSIQTFFNSVADYFTDPARVRYIVYALLVTVCAVSGYFGYQWYSEQRQQQAQLAFGQLLEEFNAASEQELADFTSLATQFSRGYEQYKNSAVAPYFASFWADASLKAGNKDDAVRAMDVAVSAAHASPSLAPLFTIKRALVVLDTDADARKEQALQELEAIARDAKNAYRDYALYHLGMYHWVHNNVDAARVAWQELIDMQDGGVYSASPWASLVTDKVESIS